MLNQPLSLSLCLLAGALVAVAEHARAGVDSIVTNPGQDCSTQMNVGWHADLDAADGLVMCTKTSDVSWSQAVTVQGKSERCDIFDGVESKAATGADIKEQAKFLDCGATLSGLSPDTQYMYRISTGGGAFSAVHYFKTAGAKEFSFVWIGDFHAYPPIPQRLKNANAVLAEAIKLDPRVSFVFSSGDVVAWGGSYSFWKQLYEQDFIANYMFANVLGNHDNMTRGGSTRYDYFRVSNNFPLNGYAGQEGVCYWFLYGKVLFITLNNEAMKKSAVEQEAAKIWAAGVIRTLRGRYQHVFLSEHYQWFDGRNGKASWYGNWKDFCDANGVTLALSGNNHVYERTHPLLHDQVVPEGNGTIYMQVPSSDGERGVEAGAPATNQAKLAFTYSSHRKSGNGVKTIGCVLVRVAADSLTTKLVYLDDDRTPHVADEHTTRFVPQNNP